MALTSRVHLPSLIVLVCAAAVVIVGLTMRSSRADKLQARATAQSIPTVAVISPSSVNSEALELPARVEAWSRAPIHARVSGYLKQWNVDIGTTVKAGQLLAEIETPDLDQTLQEARAELASARSEAQQAEATAKRWQSLLQSQSVSRQEVEERQTAWRSRRAQVNALQAAVDRAQTLQQYKRLRSPFNGVVTVRNTDVGALINTGTATGTELFIISDTRRLRVYVSVPQRQVALIAVGGKAEFRVPERPNRAYTATVHSLSQAIDSSSGAMRVQLIVDNPSGELLPGGFATVRFQIPTSNVTTLGVPPSTLIVGRRGVQVAVVGSEDRVELRTVTIARDRGNVIEIADGLTPADRVVANPPDGLSTGDRVRIATLRGGQS
ncbi:efflux RND transporter periplasmic adaptor subunit [Xanthomonas euvesicatoria]|uniref:efflux RND transporter periplasmic adaptor subunit n=1 Tax=Xanthomonas euvesicatoria TaxID=456327 RepID=UPI001C46C455|nr:efflux RND transporter periplasmic adaptor subunit [Xanthomonas euvesicatoria]MBV6848782.1 efflux RND transporter periplasmic adaptor subunit [Xanthomonas campestris pv. heliotropii]